MAVKKSSAEKRHKQSQQRRIRNRAVKSSVRTSAKKYVASVHANESDNAENLLRNLVKELDTAARKGIISRNAAARKKSRMQKLYNATFTVK
ncbi:30S ribosomal protein S20 [Brucepastera parasyntrophica]|uniref:30S ribosomal protein S20 n=1 Tax=Brucepastera parasyntrophica TaxID=2880008 RepID=UPI0021099BF5|nr:30S ribosomal protein S20 [Brucepastera parasyntrophica]ULQ59851.1 30S ribosomal protein S20 [Brucepastera parasyntrophica]